MGYSSELFPLGTNAANKSPFQTYSGYLVNILQDADLFKQVLLDVGNLRCVDFEYIHPKKLTAVFISHTHFDHTRYLGKLINKLAKLGRKEPLILYMHKNALKKMKVLIIFSNRRKIPEFVQFELIKFNLDKPYLKYKQLKKKCKTNYETIVSMKDLSIAPTLKMKIFVAPAKHSDSSVAYRIKIIEDDGQEIINIQPNTGRPLMDLVYTPDTSFQSNYLCKFAENTQFWLLDTTFSTEFIDMDYQKYKEGKRDGSIHGHSSPRYSATMCEKANVGCYIPIHYFWERFGDSLEDAMIQIKSEAEKHFSGEIIVAEELKAIKLKN